MTLIKLANFVRIAELRSMSKAAAALRIAQPALSRQIRDLEAELGSALFVRHHQGVTLTAAGDVLLARAQRLLRDVEAAREAVRAIAAEPTGRVVMGVPTSLAAQLLPQLSANLARKFPGVRAHFIDGFSANLHARTLSGELDMAVLYDDRALGPLSASPLLDEPLMLIGPAGGAAPRGSAHQMLRTAGALILPGRPNRLRLIVDALLARGAALQPVILEIDSLHAIVRMVENGHGFTVLPYSTIAAEAARGSVRAWELKNPEPSRTFVLVRPIDRQPTAATLAVTQEIQAIVRDLAAELRWRPLPAPAAGDLAPDLACA